MLLLPGEELHRQTSVGRAKELRRGMSATTPPSERAPAGVAAFFTPCLVLAATLATTLRQLGVPVGGWSFTVLLYLVLDFLSFRLVLGVRCMRQQ